MHFPKVEFRVPRYLATKFKAGSMNLVPLFPNIASEGMP